MQTSFITKSQLALAYFPWAEKKSARHMLMDTIKGDSKLMNDLIAAGYRASQKILSPLQVELITSKLGNPWRSN